MFRLGIEINNFEYEYENSKIKLGRDIQIKDGSINALLGPNGAGKTTIFLNIMGVLKPTKGEILIEGVSTQSERFQEVRKNIGLLFQDPEDQLIGPTVYEDIALTPISLGWEEDRIQENISRVIKKLGLEGLEDKPPHLLSGGEKKKVALAGLLVYEPKILILDEPFTHLDKDGRAEFLETIKKYKRKDRIILLSEHNLAYISELADNLFVLGKGGSIIFSGDYQELCRNRKVLASGNIDLPDFQKLFLDYKKIPKSIEEAKKIIHKLSKQ